MLLKKNLSYNSFERSSEQSPEEMLSPEARTELEHQQYRLIGSHSGVKICGWTKNMIRNQGGCYKLKFYGIISHQCMQLTTCFSCANRCTFCWRGYKAPVSKEWRWTIDDPQIIVNEAIIAHRKLLVGFKGGSKANQTTFSEAQTIKHVALSLSGEPLIYPRINEVIELFHRQRISTFLVTNAQYPEEIKNLHSITQLYLSIDAPNKKILKEVDQPLFSDYWERMNRSLEYLSQKKYRTTIRLTIIKGVNDIEPENYAQLIQKGSPDFVEVKAYMFVGSSRQRLKKENMPFHEDIVAFTHRIIGYLPEYEIASEHIPSRVILLAKKQFKKKDSWHTWIDFKKFFQLLAEGKEIITEDYLCITPTLTGLSGKGTKDREIHEQQKKKIKSGTFPVKIDEETDESSFY